MSLEIQSDIIFSKEVVFSNNGMHMKSDFIFMHI